MIRNVIAFAICFLGVAALFGGLTVAMLASAWGYAMMAAGAAAMLGGAKIGMRGEER